MNATEKRSVKLLAKLWSLASWLCIINFCLLSLGWGFLNITDSTSFSDHIILFVGAGIMAVTGLVTDGLKEGNIHKLNLYKEQINEYRLRKNVIKVFEFIDNKEFDEAEKYYKTYITDKIATNFLTPYILGILTTNEDKKEIVKGYIDGMKNIYDPNKIFK